MNTFKPKLGILPPSQIALWPDLKPIQSFGFVLYGGTAIALRLGHRPSVDFDFFNSADVDPSRLRAMLPFLQTSEVIQEHKNTFEVLTKSGVKISFFGGLNFGRVGEPEQTDDKVLVVASLDDLMATKAKVILQRTEAKDYQDIAAMVRAGVSMDLGLAAAERMYHPTFPVVHSLKAMTYFEGGDLKRLSIGDRTELIAAASKVKPPLPHVAVNPDLSPETPIPDW